MAGRTIETVSDPTAALEARAMQAGADRLLAKPVTAELLTATVGQVLAEHVAVERPG